MKLKSLGTALTTVALIGTAITGTAGTAAAASAPDCTSALVNIKPKETVNIRSAHTTSATALGTWGKGKKGSICTTDGKPVKGGTYTACGKKSNGWFYGGPYGSDISGWVPATCIP
ncbi:hypothetical protein ACIBW9_19785 [Streptomyces sp. NPDC049541]|uniref:hypothetical protein n=1 Tax=Streptomyces sp. NPDC049541 TaxID=3365594 RepID=UPI0037926C77